MSTFSTVWETKAEDGTVVAASTSYVEELCRLDIDEPGVIEGASAYLTREQTAELVARLTEWLNGG